MSSKKSRILRDLIIIFLSICLSVILATTGTIENILHFSANYFVLTAFLAGVLFTSVFTTPLAIAIFLVIGHDNYHPIIVALIGGVGAVVGDLIIFRFVKDALIADLKGFISKRYRRKLEKFAKYRLIAILLACIGGFIIASPFPDELGIALLAMSNVPRKYFLGISYTLNTLGILSIILVGEVI